MIFNYFYVLASVFFLDSYPYAYSIVQSKTKPRPIENQWLLKFLRIFSGFLPLGAYAPLFSPRAYAPLFIRGVQGFHAHPWKNTVYLPAHHLRYDNRIQKNQSKFWQSRSACHMTAFLKHAWAILRWRVPWSSSLFQRAHKSSWI